MDYTKILLSILNCIPRMLSGTGSSKKIAGISRIAIIALALNAQQQAHDQKEIISTLSALTKHIEANDRRITVLETTVHLAYDLPQDYPHDLPERKAQNDRHSRNP